MDASCVQTEAHKDPRLSPCVTHKRRRRRKNAPKQRMIANHLERRWFFCQSFFSFWSKFHFTNVPPRSCNSTRMAEVHPSLLLPVVSPPKRVIGPAEHLSWQKAANRQLTGLFLLSCSTAVQLFNKTSNKLVCN